MTEQNSAQNRIVDPILSTHARGYRRPDNIGKILFPVAGVNTYGGQIVEFGKEAFRLYNSKRAPGTNTRRITFGHNGKPYSIIPSALEAVVPRERMRDASQVPGINLATRAINVVLSSLELEHEAEVASLARNPANYDDDHKIALLGDERWTSPDANPSVNIATAKNAIADSIGMEPNLVSLSRSAFAALEFHPRIIERIKYTGRDAVTTDILARLWDVERVVVGRAVAAVGPQDSFTSLWGDDVVVAYASLGADVDANIDEPSYGYTYAIEGMPSVEEPYYDKSAKSWIYGVANDATPVLAGMAAGYLIQGAGAAA